MSLSRKHGILVALLGVASCQPVQRDAKLVYEPRGWYCAGSKIEDKEALGGFGPCSNYPKRWAAGIPGDSGKLSLVAAPEEAVSLRRRPGMPVYLVNRTAKTAAFAACDSQLYIVEEALAPDGTWKALEHLPRTFCGNSFHRVFLGAGEYWQFAAPKPSGRLVTKLRFRLEPEGEGAIRKGGSALYSNEFEGAIDPADLVENE
jgi:hypothetical protein